MLVYQRVANSLPTLAGFVMDLSNAKHLFWSGVFCGACCHRRLNMLTYMYHKFLMVLHQDNVGLFFPIVLHECRRPIIRISTCMIVHVHTLHLIPIPPTLYSNIGLPISTETRRSNWLPLILFKCSPFQSRLPRLGAALLL
jgi:hypothetical protein